MSLYVAGLWRYPVKTLAGERLPMTPLTMDGLPFDRIVQVHGPEGVRFYTRYKAVTQRWPAGIRAGADFSIPTLK